MKQDNGSGKFFQGSRHTPNMGEKVAQVSEVNSISIQKLVAVEFFGTASYYRPGEKLFQNEKFAVWMNCVDFWYEWHFFSFIKNKKNKQAPKQGPKWMCRNVLLFMIWIIHCILILYYM